MTCMMGVPRNIFAWAQQSLFLAVGIIQIRKTYATVSATTVIVITCMQGTSDSVNKNNSYINNYCC